MKVACQNHKHFGACHNTGTFQTCCKYFNRLPKTIKKYR